MTQDDRTSGSQRFDPRLETATMAGYRHGMTCTAVIGRKLNTIFDAPADLPRSMKRALDSLHRTADER